ncbi:MAG: MATE family efflux transporter [Ruthenibacterium sp.]
MITDMTKGTPATVLWRFSMPLLLSMVFQQMYNIVDSIVAGRLIGENALAAVGASYPVTMIFMAVATGSNIGCSVVISQLFGAKNFRRMKTAVSTSLIAALVLAAALTLGGVLVCGPLMRAMGTPDNIFGDAALYLKIYIGGLVFVFLYNMCTGAFTALGDSRTPLYFLIGSSLANIGMDLLFVAVFHMGVAGVAWATFLCQGLAGLLAALALHKRLKTVQTDGAYPLFSWRELSHIAAIAVPSILQQSFVSVGNLFIQSLVNGFGSAVVAGYSAAVKLNTFAITSFSTLGNALSNFTAQNMGGGQTQRVRKGFRAGLLMTVCVAMPFLLAYTLFGSSMVRLFVTNPSAEALTEGVRFLRIVAPFYCVICIKLMADGVLRGAGSMTYFMVATFGDLVLRVILAYALSPVFGAAGIWMSWPIGWVLAAVLSMGFYLRGVWLPRSAKKR